MAAGVFEAYEQQFSTITADITARIGRIPNTVGSMCSVLECMTLSYCIVILLAEKKTAIGVVEANLDEAGELVSLVFVVVYNYAAFYSAINL